MSHGQEPGTATGPVRAGHYQHLLGRKPVGREVFRGYGRTAYLDQQNTDNLLRRLATQMKNAWLARGKGAPGEQSPLANLRIPAGYTYLGQLVAHDLSFPSHLPEISADTGTAICPTLDLNCLYGGGPAASPWLYQVGGHRRDAREKLRIGLTDGKGGGSARPDDLPRIRVQRCALTSTDATAETAACPFGHGGGAEGEPVGAPRAPLYETLIADSRNEDNLILSQLVVLFIKFHNAVVDRLRRPGGPPPERIFDLARRYTVACYQAAIADDLLRLLLAPEVWRRYRQKDTPEEFVWLAGRAGRSEPVSIPVEFSAGVFRIGHAMVRQEYDFNDAHADAATAELMVFQPFSIREPTLPVPNDWIIDWDRFFPPMGGTPATGYHPAVSRFTPSQLLVPVTAEVLFTSVDKAPGLLYRDFVRGFGLGLPNGQALSKALGIAPVGRDVLIAALRAARRRDGLDDADIVLLADDTPLLYYALAEAEAQAGGLHLGELGSTVIAEVVFGVLRLTECPPNAEMLRHRHQVFGDRRPPETMRGIVDFVEASTASSQ